MSFINKNSEMSRICFPTIGIMLSFSLNEESTHIPMNSCFAVTPGSPSKFLMVGFVRFLHKR